MNNEDFQAKVLEHMGQQTEFQKNTSGWMEKLDGSVTGIRDRVARLEASPKVAGGVAGGASGMLGAGVIYGAVAAVRALLKQGS